MNKFGATVVKNQQFWLLWHLFFHLRLKLGCFESNLIVTRELVPLFYVESTNQNPLQSIQPPLLCSLQYSILQLKKSWPVVIFNFNFFLFCTPHMPQYFFINEADNSWILSPPNNSYFSSSILIKLASLLLCMSYQQT